jgi:hypothetical protein
MEGGRKMGIIKLRTKIEAFIVICFLIMLTTVSVLSVTRTITNSGDNSYILIRNSKGNYWDPTGANLQAAINDLGDSGGTIWVGDDITLSSEIRFTYSNMILDFEGHTVTLGADVSFINVTDGVWYSTVKNVKVDVKNGQTKSIIILYAPPNGGWAYRARFNLFENIQINNPYANNHAWTGIHLYLNIGVDSPNGLASFLENTFRKISMNSCKNGILLECDNCDAYGNSNSFDDIWIEEFENGVYFKVDPGATNGFNENVFNDVKLQTTTWSKYAFRDISHDGNHFDHCLAFDWYAASSPVHEWSIASGAWRTRIYAHYIVDILDQGSGTIID